MASNMSNCDLLNPASMTQGPGLTHIENPTGAGVSALMNCILDRAVTTNVTYALGGTYIYELSGAVPTLTTAAAPFWPHTISGANVTGEDLAHYQGALYYSYSTDASANVGMYDLTRDAETDFSDEWATTRGTVELSASVPLPIEILFNWDTVTDTYEDEFSIGGKIGGLFVDNAILYLFYQDITSIGGYKLGFLNGRQVQELCSFPGSLPQYYQISKYKGFIVWVSGGLIYAFGAANKSLPSMVFQLADGGYNTTVGALAAPFGTPMVASYQDVASGFYMIGKFSGYDTNSNWKSIMFPVGKCRLEKLVVYCDTLGTGAQADFTITADRGVTSYTSSLILDNTTVRRYEMPLGINVDNDFRVEVDWTNGSATNPAKINRIEIIGVKQED
jgi:hypothetical protein